jgi:integrase
MHAWHLEKFLVPFFGDYRLENVTLEAAQHLVASLAKSGGKDGTGMRYPSIRSVIGTLTGLLKVWREWDYKCPEIRVSRLKLPAYIPMPKESKLYQPAEARMIFRALDRETEFVCTLQTALCLRPSEVLGLSKFDFDFENKIVHIQRKACSRTRELRVIKSKQPKIVALAPEVEAFVRQWMENGYVENANGLLFRREGNELPLVQKTLRRKLRKVQTELGLARRGMHGFRHTAASIAVHVTGSMQDARTLLGHGDASRATATYIHMLGDDERRGANAVAAELFGNSKRAAKKKPSGTQTLCPDVSGGNVKVLTG